VGTSESASCNMDESLADDEGITEMAYALDEDADEIIDINACDDGDNDEGDSNAGV